MASRMYVALLIGPALVGSSGKVVAQGLISFRNYSNAYSNTLVRTNSLGLGGAAGYTSTGQNGFFYGLFIAPSTVTSLSPLDLLTPTWIFTDIYATNSITGNGGLNGGINIQISVWDNVTNSYVVAGWSANIAGRDWNTVAAQLKGASFNNGVWSGPNWFSGSSGGFFGVSSVGYGLAPDISRGLPGFDLFGSTPNAQGAPISTGWDLFTIDVPEPTIPTLAALAVIVLLRDRWRLRRSPLRASAR